MEFHFKKYESFYFKELCFNEDTKTLVNGSWHYNAIRNQAKYAYVWNIGI